MNLPQDLVIPTAQAAALLLALAGIFGTIYFWRQPPSEYARGYQWALAELTEGASPRQVAEAIDHGRAFDGPGNDFDRGATVALREWTAATRVCA
jgi:hypothetical protein